MTESLKALVEEARRVKMSAAEAEQQRLSFAYGNTKIENDRITRETVERQAALLKSQNG